MGGFLKSVRDFIKVIGYSLGWLTEFSADLGVRYYEFLKRAAWMSPPIFLAGVVCFFLSEMTNLAIFNMLGILVIAGLLLFWVIASQPVVVLGEQLAKIGLIRRIVQRVGTGLLVALGITLYSLFAPAGAEGLVHIGAVIFLVTGAIFLGFQINKRTIGVKLVALGLIFGVAIFFPQSASKISVLQQAMDRSILRTFMPEAKELNFSLDILQSGQGPRVFLDGEPLWWCRRTPDRAAGYRCFDMPGRDQITNEELVPITEQIVLEIKDRLIAEQVRLEKERILKEAQLREENRNAEIMQERSTLKANIPKAGELNFSLDILQSGQGPRVFLDGEPLWWCRRTPDRAAGYRCFDMPGRDQITNEELVPITEQIVLEIKDRLIAEQVRLEKTELEIARQAEVEKRLSLEAENLAYIDRYLAIGYEGVDFGLSFREGKVLNRSFTQGLSKVLNGSTNPQALTDVALVDGVFDRLFGGDSGETKKLRLDQAARKLILGQIDVTYMKNEAIQGVINATVNVNARVIDTNTGAIVGVFEMQTTGLGYSRQEAKKKAEDKLIAELSGYINTK